MPELPEVETIVRGLRPQLEGTRIDEVWTSGLRMRLARALDVGALTRVCRGARVLCVRRKGKFILVDVEGQGGRSGGLLVHLGMSGRLRLAAAAEPREKHTHVVWTLAGERELRLVDPRRFGWVCAGASADTLPDLAHLGPDPLSALDVPTLAAAVATSRAPIKAFLLDQRRVAGLGNIYVCEALFRGGIHPTTPARRTRPRAEALMRGIKETLTLAIANRGTTLRDYVDAHGGTGGNLAALLVYGREGKPCTTCGTPIRRRIDAARSTFFCTRCQRR